MKFKKYEYDGEDDTTNHKKMLIKGKKDQKTLLQRSQSMKEQRIKTILQRHTKFKTTKTKYLNHWEHHLNDHPLGGDC